jgi:succinate dehydrogenase / fumarate reductase, iron-sulfur subunit
MKINFKVYRFDPKSGQKPHYQDVPVEVEKGMTILDTLGEIKAHQDGTLVYRRSCRSGICGSCAMKINGFNRLACETQALLLKKSVIYVEPLPGLKPLKDLAVDMDLFYEALARVKQWLINPDPPPTDKERYQSPEDFKMIELATSCILCASCTSSCPSFWADKQYVGPAALLKAYRYCFDTRDQGFGERLEVLDNKHGLWRCHTIMNCTDCCPKHLRPTEDICRLRRKTVENRY